MGSLSRRYQNFLAENICRGAYRDTPRQVLINNWEATYFDFNSEKLCSIARQAKELGVDMLVLDDGWFGKRDSDTSGLGDWYVSEKKLGCTLTDLIQKIRDIDMDFGIWVEPEMVSHDSDLYRAHPDWALSVPGRTPVQGRSQLVIDLGRREVVEYLYGVFSSLLRSHVSACPNHQTGRTTSLHTRGIVAMSGSFGYELDPQKLSREEKEEIRKQILTFRCHRDLIFYGDYYRLTNAMTDDYFTAWQFAAKDGSAALLNVVVVAPKANPYPIHVHLMGLQPDAMYRQTETGDIYSGAALMYGGYTLPILTGDYPGFQCRFERI